MIGLNYSTSHSATAELAAILDTLRPEIGPEIKAVGVRSNFAADHSKVIGGKTYEEMKKVRELLKKKGLVAKWSPMYGEDKIRKISYSLRPLGRIEDSGKLREDFEKAMQEQYGIKMTSWFHSPSRHDGDDSKAYIRVNTFDFTKLMMEPLKVRGESLNVKLSNYILPGHPWQLVIIPPDGIAINKSTLDEYIRDNFGLAWSELTYQNQYTFVTSETN